MANRICAAPRLRQSLAALDSVYGLNENENENSFGYRLNRNRFALLNALPSKLKLRTAA